MSAAQEAERVVSTDRQKDYGHPYDDFTRAMGMLNALGYRFQLPDGTYRELDAKDQSIIMTCVKLSREVNHHKWDNIVDIHGYMKCLEMVIERMRELWVKAAEAESPPSPDSAYPVHPDDPVAERLAAKKLIDFNDWNEFKVSHQSHRGAGYPAIVAFASSKGLSISEVWKALNEAP